MADDMAVLLRALPDTGKKDESLGFLVKQINQKGGFRQVTEESLKEELEASPSGEDASSSFSEDEDGGGRSGPLTKEHIVAARNDIMQLAG